MGFTRTELGPVFSVGARKLWTVLEREGLSQGKAEKLLGVQSRGLLNRWLYGLRRPGLLSALEMQSRWDIDPATWHMPFEGEFVPPGAQS